MTVDSAPRPTIFVSYSHQDEDLAGELKKQLSHLQVPVWDDQDIPPGTNLEEAIRQHLDEATIILLLVSPNFIASPHCYRIETKRALELHRAGQTQVIPVLLRAVDWHATSFADLQSLPRSGKPLADWPNRDEAFRSVTGDIHVEVQKCQFVTRAIQDRMSQMSRTIEAPATLDEWIYRKTAHSTKSELQEELDRDFLLRRLCVPFDKRGRAKAFPNIKDMQAVRERFVEMMLEAGLHKQALEVSTSYLRVDPLNPKLRLGEGEALLALGRYQEALAAYEEAIRLAPDLSQAYRGRGRVYEQLALQTFEDLKQQAHECYEKAKELGVS